MIPIVENTFPNKVTCLVLPRSHKGNARVSIFFPGGRASESEKNCGITFLTLNTVWEHYKSRFPAFTEHVQIENHADFCGYSIELGSDHFGQALNFLSELVKVPSEMKIDHLFFAKQLAKDEISKISNDSLRKPVELFYRSLFSGHPYSLPRFGDEGSIESITIDQVYRWYQEVIDLTKGIVIISGDVDEAAAMAQVHEVFGILSYPEHTGTGATVLPLIPNRKFEPRVVSKQGLTSIVLGFKGVSLRDRRYYDLEILQYWLAGQKGQLHKSLRKNLGLAQIANAYSISLSKAGAFFIHATTKPENEEVLLEYMIALFASLPKLVVSKDTFEAAQQQAISFYEESIQSMETMVHHTACHYLANRSRFGYETYPEKIREVNQSRLYATVEELFSGQSYAVGIARGSYE